MSADTVETMRGAGFTRTEARVAELVGAGMSNREIAAALYVSIKAVEFHLTNIYRRTRVTSRVQLVLYLRDLVA